MKKKHPIRKLFLIIGIIFALIFTSVGVLIVDFTDNGVGVSREFAEAQKKPHYFEALDERLDLRHGLGLIIVKQITEAHGGTVDTPEVSTGYKTILSF